MVRDLFADGVPVGLDPFLPLLVIVPYRAGMAVDEIGDGDEISLLVNTIPR
ncbi:MAG TPA: hypothetical protein PKZ65_05370 [Methanoregulaceae archaeon]|nr:hypothetical protein [Methanoregulaceae archaeon]